MSDVFGRQRTAGLHYIEIVVRVASRHGHGRPLDDLHCSAPTAITSGFGRTAAAGPSASQQAPHQLHYCNGQGATGWHLPTRRDPSVLLSQ